VLFWKLQARRESIQQTDFGRPSLLRNGNLLAVHLYLGVEVRDGDTEPFDPCLKKYDFLTQQNAL
jgi:hypothetical protein